MSNRSCCLVRFRGISWIQFTQIYTKGHKIKFLSLHNSTRQTDSCVKRIESSVWSAHKQGIRYDLKTRWQVSGKFAIYLDCNLLILHGGASD